MDNIAAHEHDLLAYATEAVSAIPGVRLIGTATEKAGVLSFVLDGIHPARHRHHPRPGRHRHPHRPPLRAAGDGALRHPGHGARFLRALQHAKKKSTRWSTGIQKVREVLA